MPYVVTQPCVGDGSCVLACPVNCIHPAPGEPGYGHAEMLYVDPQACVDCGACTTACPVDAIQPHTRLPESQLPFIALNASYYEENPHSERTPLAPMPRKRQLRGAEKIRVAIVGAGPAAMYAADALLDHRGVDVDVYDRLPTPHGLVRAGVAPDHQDTKLVTRLFETIEHRRGFRYVLNVEVGTHVTHDDLTRHYHAVIYAVGAPQDRRLDIPGEDLPGSQSATALVGWYNGHPDHVGAEPDLSTRRAVVVGNGNVALDVARVLTADPEALATTDIATGALAALRRSSVEEVVVLGRRGPADAAFTLPELIGLAGLGDVDVVLDNGGEPVEVTSAKTEVLADLARRVPRRGRRRIILRFRTAPIRLVGEAAVTGLEVGRTEVRRGADGVDRIVAVGGSETLRTGLVLRAVGHRGLPVPGLPFQEATATVPHSHGRVRPGTYVAGWIKRGPSGFIGTNRLCAEETVEALLDDLEDGALGEPAGAAQEMAALLARAQPDAVSSQGWRRIDAAEQSAGRRSGRRRLKLTDVEEMTALAAGR